MRPRVLLLAVVVLGAILGSILLLTAQSRTTTSEIPASEIPATATPPVTNDSAEPEDKVVSLADLEDALIDAADLPTGDWAPSETPVTIGRSGGRIWQPQECGQRFVTLFEEELAPPTEDFVTVTFEEGSDDDFRIVTQNISRWDRAIDLVDLQQDFDSLIADCGSLTSDLITINLRPLQIEGTAAMRIDYATTNLAFSFDIAYTQVGTYVIGMTNSGVDTTASDMQGLIDTAVAALRTTLDESVDVSDNVPA